MAQNSTTTLTISTIGPFGGNGGSPWDDYQTVSGITGIVGFTIGSGRFIDSFQAVYQTQGGVVLGPRHGGGGGGTTSVTFGQGEKIIGAGVRSGQFVDSLLFVTIDSNGHGRQYGPYGGTGGSYTPVNGEIIAFMGRAGSFIDAIGFYGYNLTDGVGSLGADELVAKALKLHQKR
jgi:hypothetical protein